MIDSARSPFPLRLGVPGPRTFLLAITVLAGCAGPEPAAEEFVANYDEALVPEYTLPELLVTEAGERIIGVDSWREVRRPEILELFEEHVFGANPEGPFEIRTEVLSPKAPALEGAATREEIRVHLTADPDGPSMDILLYLPRDSTAPVATFLTLNFYGNHSIHPDPEITLSTKWMRQNDDFGIVDNRATEASRGVRSSRWPVERIIERGYGLATIYYGDIDPDYDDAFLNGIHPYYSEAVGGAAQWSSIGAWAWGLSRAMDYLVTEPAIDARRVAVMGHSRLGKTALWAGAQDERFIMVISNDSGAGGAALSRRAFGETVGRINRSFPHWFNPRFKTYNEREDALPVDQHMLLALMSPRPLYVASAQDDEWADPRGEFLSAWHAGRAYELYGLEGLPINEWPPVNTPVMGTIGYHIRTGPHDVRDYDWERFMDFADMHLQ